jgi:glycosyltransferase involved in cell wall biosynthesis
MTTRNLLLVTYHFPPSAASGTFRMLSFARHLPRSGWRVRVVAPPEMPWDPVDAALTAQVPAETEYVAVPYPRRLPRLVRWAAPYAVWLPSAWVACRRLVRQLRPDVVVTSGPPHVVHLLGLWLKRFEALPWVADFRDPWISGVVKPPLTLGQRWMRRLERAVLRGADRVIANAPNAGQLFRETYPREAEKVITLTNGFDPPPTPRKTVPFTGTVRMLHAGEIYLGRDPLPLLDAIAALKQAMPAAPVRLEVMGTVHLPQGDLATEIARRGLTAEVLILGQLPYQEALQEMTRSDLLVLLEGPGRRIGVPAKLYEYLGAGRPILALTEPDGDTEQVLRDSGVQHRIAPPKDPVQITQALAELVRDIAAGKTVVTDPERLRRFTREAIAEKLAEVLAAVAAEQGESSGSRAIPSTISDRRQAAVSAWEC